MASSLPRVVLVLLIIGAPLVAQDRARARGALAGQAMPAATESWPTADEPLLGEATEPVVVKGRVLLPDGRPAAGAVVVSSAGGSAEVREDGSYVLEVRVGADISALQLTAVANGPRGSLTAQRVVPGILPWGTTASEPLYLTSGSGCTPDWLPTFGEQPGVNGTLRALAVFDDGSGAALHAGGHFTSAGSHLASRIAKWDGSTWSPLGEGVSGSNSWIGALAVFDDGSGAALYAGGAFATAGDQPANRIAKWDGSAWSRLGSGMNGGVHALAVFDDGSGEALYAGGTFTSAGDHAATRIAKWDGSAWSPLGSGVTGTASPIVFDLAVFDDGSGEALYVGGRFTAAGGFPANHIARWDGSAWSPLGSGVTGPKVPGVSALAVFDDGTGPALYAGGSFTNAGGQAANQVAKWDGSGWSPLGSGVTSSFFPSLDVLAVFDDGTGPALYAGGLFTSAGGQPVNQIAKWDGSVWSPLGTGVDTGIFDARVWALTVFDGGSGEALFVGGHFRNAGGQPASRIAKWDGAAWSPLGSGVSNDSVRALAVFDDGSGEALYAGGSFTVSAAGDSYLAKWGCASSSAVGLAYCFGDGSGTPCPCGNVGAKGRGCAGSTGAGAVIAGSGSARASADDLAIEATGLGGCWA